MLNEVMKYKNLKCLFRELDKVFVTAPQPKYLADKYEVIKKKHLEEIIEIKQTEVEKK